MERRLRDVLEGKVKKNEECCGFRDYFSRTWRFTRIA